MTGTIASFESVVAEWTARLDRMEQVARATRQVSLSWRNFDDDNELRDSVNAGTVAFVPGPQDREHISLNDPQAVLGRVAADRKILDQYRQAERDIQADVQNMRDTLGDLVYYHMAQKFVLEKVIRTLAGAVLGEDWGVVY